MEQPTSSAHTVGTRKVTSFDGTELHAQMTLPAGGATAPTVVCCNGIGVSTFFWTYLESHLVRKGHSVITWDYRGHNRSGPGAQPDNFTIEACARDLLHVVEAFGEGGSLVLVGHSMGVQVTLEFSGQFPDRVSALVPMLGTAGHPLDRFMGSPIFYRGLFRFFEEMSQARPDLLARLNAWLGKASWMPLVARASGLVDALRMSDDDLQNYLEHFSRMDPAAFFALGRSLVTHSCEEFLDQVDVPTLVVAGECDLFTPVRSSEELASRLPNAELFVVPEGSHACLVEQPDLINGRVSRFLEANGLGACSEDDGDTRAA